MEVEELQWFGEDRDGGGGGGGGLRERFFCIFLEKCTVVGVYL